MMGQMNRTVPRKQVRISTVFMRLNYDTVLQQPRKISFKLFKISEHKDKIIQPVFFLISSILPQEYENST